MNLDPPKRQSGERSSFADRVGCLYGNVPVMPYGVDQLRLLRPEAPSQLVPNPTSRITQIRIGFGEQLLDSKLERRQRKGHDVANGSSNMHDPSGMTPSSCGTT